jgi:hypothetical protein
MKKQASSHEQQYLAQSEAQYGKTLVRDGVKTRKPGPLVVGQLVMVKVPQVGALD